MNKIPTIGDQDRTGMSRTESQIAPLGGGESRVWFPGGCYGIKWFTPTFVHHRCHATITVCIAEAMAKGEAVLPNGVIQSATDLMTWRISRGSDSRRPARVSGRATIRRAMAPSDL